MSLENINCPQFVDFCSVDTFDIHDGADFCFEKGVVGEDAKLGTPQLTQEQKDTVDGLISILSNATNLNSKPESEEAKKVQKPINKNNEQTTQKCENKENKVANQSQPKPANNEKKPEIVEATTPSVGSAIEMVNSAASAVIKENKTNTQSLMQKAKTPVKNNTTTQNNNRIRTLSTSSAASNATTKTADKPLLPMYTGVKFIPKLAHKYSSNSNESYLPGSSAGSQTPSSKDNHSENSSKNQADKNDDKNKPGQGNSHSINPTSTHKPLILGNNEKKGNGLTRSTPGKSASFKQQNSQKKPGIITSITTNIMKIKTAITKNSYSNDAEFNASNVASKETHPAGASSLDNTQVSNSGETKQINKSSISSSSITKPNVSNLNGRKKSDSKPVGLLNTELRALKRTEYEQHMKEKERMAHLIRQDLEKEKMKKQQEEIQKLRIKNTFRSNPIKHYKPVEVKPSEKPLTSPRSPQFAINNSHEIKSKGSSSVNSSISISTTITSQSSMSQEV